MGFFKAIGKAVRKVVAFGKKVWDNRQAIG